jgi:hypothetical protein
LGRSALVAALAVRAQFGVVTSPNRYGLPPFYELHAWLWKPNPSGMFYE